MPASWNKAAKSWRWRERATAWDAAEAWRIEQADREERIGTPADVAA